MKLSWQNILSICLFTLLSLSANAFASGRPAFAAAEHVLIGDDIKLYFSANDPGRAGIALELPNGLSLSYGDIISLGDFYGIPDQPISFGNSDAERRKRFMAAFNTFASHAEVIAEAKKILDVIHEERTVLLDGIKQGKNPEDIYQAMGHAYDAKWNCITGGGCDPKVWWLIPGKYLKLVNQNYDHFGDQAVIAYKVGHQLALELAAAAHANNDIKQLQVAYAMNAFACHFFTDRFAAGHLRTPRQELAQQVTPAVIGTLLANYMHNEENPAGLHIHNANGDHWIAYGDKSLLSTRSQQHGKMIHIAIQNSANEIFAAFMNGTSNVKETACQYMPIPDETGAAAQIDVSSLFYWDTTAKKLLRRSMTSQPFDKNWTDQWWGWSTLILLNRERGLPIADQAALATSSLRDKALEEGLITNKDFIAYIKKHP